MVLANVDGITMDSVAEAAGVSRPLLYKHFANRHELLTAVYRREAALLHEELAEAVRRAPGLEDKFRALMQGAIQAQSDRGAALSALRAAGGRDREFRDEQRRRDRATVRYFSRLAVAEYGVPEQQTTAMVSILLRTMESVLSEWRRRPTAQHASELVELYVTMCVGALRRMAEPR